MRARPIASLLLPLVGSALVLLAAWSLWLQVTGAELRFASCIVLPALLGMGLVLVGRRLRVARLELEPGEEAMSAEELERRREARRWRSRR